VIEFEEKKQYHLSKTTKMSGLLLSGFSIVSLPSYREPPKAQTSFTEQEPSIFSSKSLQVSFSVEFQNTAQLLKVPYFHSQSQARK